jgi:manganese efflux pump family protein
VQFGVSALERSSPVTSVPAACRGLTNAEINSAVARAIDIVVGGGRGKAARRARAASLSPLLARLIQTVPARAPEPGARPGARPGASPAARPAARVAAGDREVLGIPALFAWLFTASLGTAMIRRWILRLLRRNRSPDAPPRAGQLSPAVIVAHAGLAAAGLLAWVGYLIAGWGGAGWAACVILLLATSLGVAQISLWLPERGQARHPPVILVAGHGVLAVTTITLVLAALGSG